MDADWDELSRQLLPPPGGQSVPSVVTTLAFDTTQELLWAGNGYGRVTSFYGSNLQKYTSFRAHPPAEGAVQQLLFNDKGIIALGGRGVHMAIRRGLPVWPHITADDMRDLRCMSFTSKATSEILVAGVQDTMFVIDTNKGEIVKRKSRYICAATSDGHVHILDPVKFTVVHRWRAHSAFINDMDVQQDFVVTCGTSLKQPAASYMLDPFVMVFDLKNLSTMPPIPFPPLAAYIRMHPRMLTTGIVASQGGQIHVVDLLNPNTSNVRQANVVGSILTGIEIAPSGEAIVLADTDCNMHLWASPSKCHFVDLPQPTEWPDEETPLPIIDWKENTPLHSIGVPYYRESLLSAFPNIAISDVGSPPPKITQNDMIHMTKASFGFYGPNHRQQHRNQVENTRLAEKASSAQRAPKFLSEKARDSAKSHFAEAVIEAQVDKAAHQLGTSELESLKPDVPGLYQNVEIQFSKYGVDDFDFEFYNKTRYAGLENHIANSYANSLLQVFHFTPLIRNLALQHTATDCLAEKCLLCELGFLSDMLQKTVGMSCHASNLLKCLSNHPPASRLGLLEEDYRQGSLTKANQSLTRFLLQTMADDYRTKSPTPTAMEELLATSALTTIRCLQCRNETCRSGSSYVTDLTHPLKQGRGHRAPKITFSQVLKSSVEGETATRGWCVRCGRYQSLQTRKIIQGIPSALTLNVPIAESREAEMEQRLLWATPNWLPEEIGIIVDNGSFFCYQGEDLKLHLQRGVHNIQVYSLIGLSVNIENGSPQKPHLAALSPVGAPEAPGESRWHLFNDFSVKPVSVAEALTFNTRWKMPSVLVYQLKTANNKLDTDWVKNIDTSVLHIDFKPDAKDHPYRVLNPHTERPGPQSVVALDTEFVLAKQSEVEMKSDGVREVIRPNFHALGRVSIVRGSGEDEGLAFIDDWIQVREPVIDYLHKHSGILAGDLDPRTSNHCLVSLKIAYKRLWVLLNLGCKFVGHGLRGDFRVINIQVPKAQIIDTIDLFYQKNYRRKLSLKFLAWFLLKEGIQVDTHDSIEDARIALKLYRKFLEFEDAGITKKMLNEIYRAGDSVGWKPPGPDQHPNKQGTPGGPKRTGTPPLGQVDGPSTPIRKSVSSLPSSLGTPMGFTPGGTTSPFK
ncbi:PAB-dependent poly(A)-specific ribonuclease subunit pan2 [Cryphonectria parasitica EP155]|uniref:PAN2-PAN3 deadenylation complex catalytic subunit PAN2 n=1 Tax=Cryphonectria parasitica (strain ATCC 38755 / EP155) TaxID=660469 RepID=A0A9P4XVF3_CRYP1|nr:PAB-dependent poly(A)-specific ribonuclease subunit pan2 [Cryphonectria parasitica EP155]KAF3761547.1 PAB-dependent poly(A)-specific ribonuclease subunit pan2 [Cryphonectria parasitica EP155]